MNSMISGFVFCKQFHLTKIVLLAYFQKKYKCYIYTLNDCRSNSPDKPTEMKRAMRENLTHKGML